MRTRLWKKLRIRRQECGIAIKYLLCKGVSAFLPRGPWVITERGCDARDNGYWLYRYIKDHHPEQKIYFFIDRNSPDYHKVQSDAVQPGSMKSYLALASAEKLISTHYAAGLPMISSKLFRTLRLHEKFYFLQHGVIKDALEYLYGNVAPMRLFICGAQPEYEYVASTFGHPVHVVQYLGLARFDQLHDFETHKSIVVMPTWRQYLSDEQTFLTSEYYHCWQQLLKSPAVKQLLEQHDMQLYFYLHHGMQQYAHHFSAATERIVIAQAKEFDVQTLLKESAVLITDYSSVSFDFAYMRKPMIYFQFDEANFFSHHYKRGYFDYRHMGFGDVCTSEHEVIISLKRIVDNHLCVTEGYLRRGKAFFPLFDQENCKRIYDAIVGDRL